MYGDACAEAWHARAADPYYHYIKVQNHSGQVGSACRPFIWLALLHMPSYPSIWSRQSTQ